MPVRRAATFTLVELMVSLSILSVLMLLLVQFVISAQRAMLMSEGIQRMNDDQRVALEIIERDLSSAVVSSMVGQEVGLYVSNPDTDGGDVLSFVTHGMGGVSGAEWVEVNYRVENYQLKRVEVMADSADWDFYGQTMTTAPPWAVQANSTYETVLYDGVAEMQAIVVVYENGASVVVPPGTVVFTRPVSVTVNLVLFDTMQAKRTAEARVTSRQVFSREVTMELQKKN